MGFHLEKGEDSAAGLRRILQEQIAHLLEDLGGKDKEDAIHEARKRCKRVRALLRLLPPAAEKIQERENRAFRDMAHALSDLRDAVVQGEAFAELVKQEPRGAFRYAPLLREVRRPARSFSARAQQQKMARVQKQAVAAQKRFTKWVLPEGQGLRLIEKKLMESYRKGRKTREAACISNGAPAFHEWRKRVKDLGYQMQILRRIWPRVLKKVRQEIDALGDLLGQEHDLAILRSTVLARAKNCPPELLRSFLNHLDARASELRIEAQAIGRRVYAENPRAFIKRIRAYWEAWQMELPVAADS